ncbi:MAG TPA: glycosyltransferase family 2 protein, partial [Anaerolineaceae bacterium]|nr:glycosyltransferase family 2 protein [Anaerolineaceae bacterium]
DEFAENHHKNMVIREFMGRGIPCAGVGGGFSRKALETLAGENPQHVVFRLGSLTEDYEMGMRLNAIGIKKAIFVKWPIYRTVTQKRLFGRGTKKVTVRELISIRNVFPKDFTAAVRQKARWIAGIALQGWENLGWEGDLLTKYVLFKDRKALVTCQINVLGYVVFLSVMFYYAVIWLAPDAYRFPPLVEEGTLLWYLIIITTVFLIHRIILRMFCVYKFYGIKQSLTAIPNLVWSSFINFFATNRALHLFYNYLVTGQWIKWDHTAHVPPTEEELQSFRRRIGDMLVEKRIITIKELEGVLEEQKQSGKMLGDILIGKGMVSEDELLQTLGVQLRVSTREIDPYETSLELLKLFPRELAVKHSIYPAEIRNNKLIVAASHMVAKEILGQVETVT